jgi:hypothetical protein
MDNRKVNAEVLGVLMASGEAVLSRIPKSVINYLKENSDKGDIPQFDPNKTISECEISKEARTFLTVLKLQYLCDTEEEKQELIKKIADNKA